MSEATANLNSLENHDAKLAQEAIAMGEEKAQKVDVEADYAAAQQFSVSEIDRAGEGAKAAEEATGHQFELSQPETTTIVAESTSDPADYAEMAKDVSPASLGAANVTDDLVKKALDMGRPSES